MDVWLVILLGALGLYGWSVTRQRKQAIYAFVQAAKRGQPLDVGVLEDLSHTHRLEALRKAVRVLQLDDRHELAAPLIAELRELDGGEAHQAALRAPTGDLRQEALEALAERPKDVPLRLQLIDGLQAAGEFEEALRLATTSPVVDPALVLEEAHQQMEMGDWEAALDAARRAQRAAESGTTASAAGIFKVRQQARLLVAELGNADPLERQLAMLRTGELQASWQAWLALGLALVDVRPSIVAAGSLDHPREVLDGPEPASTEDWIRHGASYLRNADPQRAVRAFDQAVAVASEEPFAVLGRAAAGRAATERTPSRLRALPPQPEPVDLLPQWDVLSDMERRALGAAVRPVCGRVSSGLEISGLGQPLAVVCWANTLETQGWPAALWAGEQLFDVLDADEVEEAARCVERVSAADGSNALAELMELRRAFAELYRDWLVETHFGSGFAPLPRDVVRSLEGLLSGP